MAEQSKVFNIAINLEELIQRPVITGRDGKEYICVSDVSKKEYNGKISYQVWVDVQEQMNNPEKCYMKLAYDKTKPDQKAFCGNGFVKTFGQSRQHTTQQPSQQQPKQQAQQTKPVQEEKDDLPF